MQEVALFRDGPDIKIGLKHVQHPASSVDSLPMSEALQTSGRWCEFDSEMIAKVVRNRMLIVHEIVLGTHLFQLLKANLHREYLPE